MGVRVCVCGVCGPEYHSITLMGNVWKCEKFTCIAIGISTRTNVNLYSVVHKHRNEEALSLDIVQYGHCMALIYF